MGLGSRTTLSTWCAFRPDEPTGSLDRENAESRAALRLELNREEGVARVRVTHAADRAARAGRTLTLRDGRLT